MPTSRSPKPGARQPPAEARSRLLRPLILMAVAAALCVTVIALPASLIRRFLPPSIVAQDFSGTVWHGSAGQLQIDNRNLGAVEWTLHPAALLGLDLSAELHWVKTGFVADGTARVDSEGLQLSDFAGGGPIEDLRDLGVVGAWRGTVSFKFTDLKVSFAHGAALTAAVGDINVGSLASPQVASGADLGGYALHAADTAITPGTDAAADITDTGGPLEVHATLHLSADAHTGTLSGTVRAREDAAPALRTELDQLAQMHARDAAGAIPVDLEFTL